MYSQASAGIMPVQRLMYIPRKEVLLPAGSLVCRQKWGGLQWPPRMARTLQAGLSELLQFAP